MKKVLFFDMYQTLVETKVGDKKESEEIAHREVFSDFLIKNNLEKMQAETFQKNYEGLRDEFYKMHDKETHHHNFKELIKRTFADFYTIDVDDETLMELIWQYRLHTRGETKLYPKTLATLESLSKQHELILASYTQSSYSLKELEIFGIKKYFTKFVFSSDIGYKKMSDTFYQKCIEVSETEAENCVMIGDNRKEDMYMAHKNGMKTIWIKNPITMNNSITTEIHPDGEVDLQDFDMLVDIIDSI